jgi:TRAP-type uncharacterized transport system fused permease subunit
MSGPESDVPLEQLGEERETVEKLLERDAKTGRKPAGVWHWLVAGLSAAMVLFYFYTAGLTSVATQYHRGVYVFITYVLVFLLYPAGGRSTRIALSLVLGATVSCVISAALFHPDVASFHASLMQVGEAWGAGNRGAVMTLWPLALGTAAVATLLMAVDPWLERRFPGNPVLSDALFAVAAGSVVLYWVREFESLNYRAGASTP